jgi:hypothetical protein
MLEEARDQIRQLHERQQNPVEGVTCLRCRQPACLSYGFRLHCRNCGYTFHKDSATMDDEEKRRNGSV